MTSHPPPVLFSYAFRIFFLCAGSYAVLTIALWLLGFHGFRWPAAPAALSPYWHAHEVALGFGGAVVAGFLLTAVANWTGRPNVRGPWLMVLTAAWLAGRLVGNFPGPAPVAVVATVDLLFPIILAGLATREIVIGMSRRNYGIAAITWTLAALTALYHLGTAGVISGGERVSTAGMVHLLALLIAVIGGRVIPGFTGNWLRTRGESRVPRVQPSLDRLAVTLLAVAGLADSLMPGSAASGTLCLLAGGTNLWRLAAWRGTLTARNPLLWSLHIGFAALATGYLLLGVAALGAPLPRSAALHMVTVGGVGGVILAMMTRVALGHTGRPLAAAGSIAAAYLLLAGAALLRSLGPAIPGAYRVAIDGAALLWVVVFVVFLAVYIPILARPRQPPDPGQALR